MFKRTLSFAGIAAGLAVIAGVMNWWPLAIPAAQAQTRNLPVFEVDRGWPTMPPKWKLGLGSSFAVDEKDNIWFLHRPWTLEGADAAMAAPPVIVFDAGGNFIRAWGGAGKGYEWPEREHGIHVDHKGFVWITGNYCPTFGGVTRRPVDDDQVLKFNQNGEFILQIGRSNQSKGNADTQNVHRASDLVVHPETNELFVADGYGNHRVAVFDADSGVFKRMWGAFGNNPVDDEHCPLDRTRSMATVFPEPPGPQNFSTVHAIRVSKDGLVYVADRDNRRVQVFTMDGKYVSQLVRTDTPFAMNLAFSADPSQQFLYVGGGPEITIVDRKTLTVAGSIAPPGMVGTGHAIVTDSKGNIYIAQGGGNSLGIQKLRQVRSGY